MSPPISPRTTMADVIKEEVARATEALRRDLEDAQREIKELKGVDEDVFVRLDTKSGQYRDLAKDIRDSKPEIEAAVTEKVTGTVTEKTLAMLEAFRSEMRAERNAIVKSAPAAITAANASITAANASTSAALDTEQIRAKQRDAEHASRLRFWLTLIPVIGTAIATIVQAFR